jgi:Bacterial regulatory protein, arsR family.
VGEAEKGDKRKILKLFSENPSLQIPECAKILDMKYSYVYTSIAQLRKMGKLEHKQLDFTTGIWIVKQGGQA